MSKAYWVLIGALVSGWLIVTVGVPLIAALCRRHALLDQPGPLKVHTRPTPRLTGIAVWVGLWAPVALATVLFPETLSEFRPHAIPVILSAILVLVVGVIDDLRPFSSVLKLIVQAVAGLPLWFGGIGFTQLWVPFVGGIDLGPLALPVSMIWFLMLVNSVNMIDGVDGLATATTAIATATLIWLSAALHLPPVMIGAGALLGALLAFWRFNRAPARAFLGDSGSLTLGHFFAVVALLAPIKRFTAIAFFLPLLALMLPLAESTLTLFRRSMAGAHPLRGDLGHVHHMLLRRGWSANQIVATYSVISMCFGLFCLGYRYLNRKILTIGLAFFVLLLGVGLAIILRSQKPGPQAPNRRPVHEE